MTIRPSRIRCSCVASGVRAADRVQAPLHLEAALSQANVSLGPGSLMSRFRTMLPDPLLEDDERFRWPS